MKRWLIIIVATVVCWGLASACSDSGAPGSQTTPPPGDTSGDTSAGTTPDGLPKPPPDIVINPPVSVSPVVGISGIADGEIFGGPKDVTVTADASPNNSDYAWSLKSPGLPDKTGSGTSFAFTLPESKINATQYSLQLTVTSTTKLADSKTIHFQVYPAPSVPKIEMSGKCPPAGCPFNGPREFGVKEGGTYASDFKWQINVPSKAPAACETVAADGKTCFYTPTEEGQFSVSVTATGKGGSTSSNAVAFLVAKGVPIAKMIGTIPGQKFYIAPLTFQGNGKDYPKDVVTYSWTKGTGNPLVTTSSTADNLPLTIPGDYIITLTVTVNGKSSDTIQTGFTLLPALTVEIQNLSTQKSLPPVVPVSKKEVTLKAVTNITVDYDAPVYAWAVIKPDKTIVNGNGEFQKVTFDQAGVYTFKVLLTSGGKDKLGEATTTAAYQAIATIDGIQDKHSYLKRALKLVSKSENADQLSWTLFDAGKLPMPNYTDVKTESFGIHEGDLKYGPYTVELTANNKSGLSASIDTEAFNIRVAEQEILLPFTPGNANVAYALDESNIFVGGANNLSHLGEDGLWTKLYFNPNFTWSAIWARSVNEIYAAAYVPIGKIEGTVFRYTAKEGWKELSGGEAFVGRDITMLTGNADQVVALTTDNRVHVLHGGKWDMLQDMFNLAAAAPDKGNMIFTVGDNRLFVYDSTLAQKSVVILPVGQSWTALLAVSSNMVFLANAAGEIYRSDGKKIIEIGKSLPLYQGKQQYAKLLWTLGTRVYALTQNSGEYSISSKLSEVVAPSDFYYDSVTATDLAIVAIRSGKLLSPKLNAQNQFDWDPLFPDSKDPLMQSVYADKTTTARSSGETVYVMNAKTVLPNMNSYLQQIAPNGTRTALPVSMPIVDLFGVNGMAYFVTDNGAFFKYDGKGGGMAGVATPGGKILALDGEPTSSVKLGMFYVLTESGLFQSDAQHKYKQIVTLQDPLKATAFHMLDGQWIVASSTDKANYITVGEVAKDNVNLTAPAAGNVSGKILKIAGTDLDHLFAISATAIYQYDKTTSKWNQFNDFNNKGFVYRDIQRDATHLYFMSNEDVVIYDLVNAKFSVKDDGVNYNYYYAFFAQGSPDFVYDGVTYSENQKTYLVFSRFGPMQ